MKESVKQVMAWTGAIVAVVFAIGSVVFFVDWKRHLEPSGWIETLFLRAIFIPSPFYLVFESFALQASTKCAAPRNRRRLLIMMNILGVILIAAPIAFGTFAFIVLSNHHGPWKLAK
jgi:hypothetical protein